MNWKAEAIDRLGQYDAARCAMESLSGEIRRIEELLCSPGGAKLEGRVRSSQSHEDWQLGQLVSLQELRQRKDQTQQWLRATEAALAALTPEERLVLHRMYICPQKNNVNLLCQELDTERSTVYRKRDTALQRFTLALYGPM